WRDPAGGCPPARCGPGNARGASEWSAESRTSGFSVRAALPPGMQACGRAVTDRADQRLASAVTRALIASAFTLRGMCVGIRKKLITVRQMTTAMNRKNVLGADPMPK